jgi:hypothetical protein
MLNLFQHLQLKRSSKITTNGKQQTLKQVQGDRRGKQAAKAVNSLLSIKLLQLPLPVMLNLFQHLQLK